MSEVPTPSEKRTSFLVDFIDLRDSLRHDRIGHGGREVSQELTRSLDRALVNLLRPLPDGLAVVALGGYGREELSPYSDVDLMLLHEVDDASSFAAELFRPLWDARLRVGHSVRTVKEAGAAARENFDTQTTLLTARLVHGSADLFDAMKTQVAAVTKARPLRRYLVEAERRRRDETPFLLMATDVKTGRGGLRTLQSFEWERRREEMIGRFTAESSDDEALARESLMRVRNALHVSARRAHDVYDPELRDPVARWLGEDAFDVAAELMAAIDSVDRMAIRRWPEVVEPRRGSLTRRIRARIPRRPDQPHAVSPPTADELAWILESGEEGQETFARFWERGLLDHLLPEWDVVRALPQLEPFHSHPVGAHLWRTVAEMNELIAEDGPYGRVAAEIGRDDLLRLAAFLHDIGKGLGGDHAAKGAVIAGAFARRLGLSEADAEILSRSTELHLLLPLAATRRDLDDPAVIDEIADEIGSLMQLQVLHLLTVADSRATGPSMWNSWKATLVRTLVHRSAARLGSSLERATELGTSLDEVLATVSPDRVDQVRSHVEQMPDDYLRSLDPEDVIRHLDLIDATEGLSNLGVRAASPFDIVTVVGPSRPGFRRLVASAFAANGVDVLEARMLTRGDGMVLDAFVVRDDRAGGRVDEDRWHRVESDVESALAGAVDTEEKVATRAAAYRTRYVSGAKPTVTASVDAASGDVILVVKCSDRVGRLAEILSVLSDCGVGIRLAKLDSREGEVVDTFHVTDLEGGGDLAALETRVAGGISP
ncbi:MAG TPA: HD domain-containing protein [Acidimicrobiia bacterium]|nr:HD domain-containing protein [Acidimicrobiia bacterium]